MEILAWLVFGAALWAAYHLWYVPRGTKTNAGSRPTEVDKQDKH